MGSIVASHKKRKEGRKADRMKGKHIVCYIYKNSIKSSVMHTMLLLCFTKEEKENYPGVSRWPIE